MRQVGVFCGTFNPVHWGHLLMAECARDQFELEKVIFITSPNPPHRNSDLLSAEHRYELVRAAVAENPNFEASRIELERDGPSYTVDTLRELKQLFGEDTQLNLIVGEDNLPYLSGWHNAAELFQSCRLLIAPRATSWDGNEATPPDTSMLPKEARTAVIQFPHVPVSGSDIRKRLRSGHSVLYLVPAPVNELLLNRKFYVDKM